MRVFGYISGKTEDRKLTRQNFKTDRIAEHQKVVLRHFEKGGKLEFFYFSVTISATTVVILGATLNLTLLYVFEFDFKYNFSE